MTDAPLNGSTRCAGAMEPLYWSPASPVFEMSQREAAKLPQRVVWFGSTLNIPKEVVGFIRPQCRNLPFLMQSNFEVGADLEEKLRAIVAECVDGQPAHAWDASRMTRLLAMQEDCLQAFDACVAARRHEGIADGGAHPKHA